MGLKIQGDAKDKKWIDLDAGGISIGLHAGAKVTPGTRAPKIVFYCKDVDSTRTGLIELGAKLSSVKYFGTLQFCDGKDPEGNAFQISNRP